MPPSASQPSFNLPTRSRLDLAAEVVETCRKMNAMGLNQGPSGNVSMRLDERHFLITPSGLAYDAMRPEDVPVMDMAGQWFGRRRPSTEWRFHRDVLKSRVETNVVLHTHSMFSTTLACLRRGIPPFHYMIAVAGGDTIRCASYATFGTQALSDNVLKALEGRKACLLANHGLICVGVTLEKALGLAVEVETLAGMYCRARQHGIPRLLDHREMTRIIELFRTYGTPEFPDAELKQAGDEWPGGR